MGALSELFQYLGDVSMGTFIRNLRFAHKFLLIGLLAGLMLAVPTVIFVRVNLANIALALSLIHI